MTAQTPMLRVVTWNIHSCVGIDARFDPDRVADVIRSLAPDVIALQEVGWHHRGERGFDQFGFLARATGLHAVAGPTKRDLRSHYGNALLSRHPIAAVRLIDISQPFREPRGAIDVDVDAPGGPIRVIAAHLGLDPWERAAQVARILDGFGPPDGRPALFMGDLNEWRPDSPRLRHLRTRLPHVGAPRSFHARFPTLRLDRIFLAGPLAFRHIEAVRTKLTRHASDHLPVRALVARTAED